MRASPPRSARAGVGPAPGPRVNGMHEFWRVELTTPFLNSKIPCFPHHIIAPAMHNLVSANRTLRMELANSRSSRSGKLDYSLVPSIAFAGPARARAAVRIAIRKQGIAG
eukprot:gene14237-biopygen3582